MVNHHTRGTRPWWVPTIALLLLVAPLLIPDEAAAFSGILSSIDAGVAGTGNWIVNGPTWIEWDVTKNADDSWHYAYVFGHPRGATSHFILETSENFTADDIYNASGDFRRIDIGVQRVKSGAPNMPEDVYGIRFDDAWGNITNIEFDSFRVPVWGDFYSKNGKAGGHGFNTAWNGGFTLNDWDPDLPAANGSLGSHILVPDSQTAPVPEPSTLILLGSGLAGMAMARGRWIGRRRTREVEQ